MSENVGIGRKFEVPDDWDVSTIESNITDIGDGGTPDTSVEHYFGGNIRWAKIEDINFKIGDTENHLTEEGLNNSSAKLWPEGSVIVTTGATIGKVGITQEPIATKQGITGIVTNNNLDSRYFAYYLLSERKSLQRFAQGGTFEEIRPYILKRLRLPLPPIHEQRRIAEILSTVDELIHQTDAVIEQTERLKRGLMQDLLTQGIGHESFQKVQIGPKNIEIPSSWCVVDLAQIADIKGGKRLPKEHNFSDEVTSYPYLRVSDFQNHSINTKNLKYLEERTAEKLDKYIISENDLFISIAGTIGKVGTIPNHLDNSYLTENAAKIRITGGIDNGYLQYYLLGYIAQNEFDRRSIVTTQPKLSLYNIRRMPCFLPSMHEQKEIAKCFSAVDDTIQKEQQIKTKLEALKRGLMQDLLTGKVRVPVET
jgi:type I restriction enzyme S subunit